MKLTRVGTDIITVDESNYKEWCNKKIHIIKLAFQDPTKDKIYKVFDNYKLTNRFIIDDKIRFYNYILKYVNKKYYVSNTKNDKIVTFFKKNNKVVLNMFHLSELELDFMNYEGFLMDVLDNLEVIIVHKSYYMYMKQVFIKWPGNLIISNGDDI